MSEAVPESHSTAPILEMRGIVKTFPGVRALDGVGFHCGRGEVRALVGENGAGKSTLIKILSGVYQADSGSILLEGSAVAFNHPVESLAAGISVIYQEFSLLPDRTVADNIFLGREPVRRGIMDRARMRRETREALALFGSGHGIEPDSLVSELGIAQQQMVEIAKAVSLEARVVVMDEPTAALDENECAVLFSIIERLKQRGTAVVYITHRMREVTRLADTVTVLKDGSVAAEFDHLPEPSRIVNAMVGRALADFYPPAAAPEEIGDPVLTVRGGGNDRLFDIDFDLRAGEITSFAGIQGAGRTAVALALFGRDPFTRGTVTLAGKEVRFKRPREAIRAGLTIVPGDRKAEGLFLMQPVIDNGMVSARAFAGMLGSHKGSAALTTAGMEALFDQLDVRAADYDQEIQFLSGGNQQKVVVARWLSLAPKVLIFIEPTRGVDVNAKAGIYDLMRELARGGAAIMMVSSDLPEVLGASDRILVMREGRIVAEHRRGVSEATIMADATGHVEVAA
ncbi:sugar ABC transporter ATP-binding protein [Chelativorans sp. M5D2P16]|uniref:sugar ABC transporter ATP-binding protein n=1 Tax=Chelativorans sp. M5D2P16 TaxID=3095678 RepID=UPI002ACA3F9F|nr:sugar ABC transporter ATP-binding protein [Chelativorans sp. M5D2P16]MDZ5698580.1 sugar ABC transporter ATP-binding protein [Chelativorans sp. M5D2P16]